MNSKGNSKTIIIILVIVFGLIVLGGLLVGCGYLFYKIGSNNTANYQTNNQSNNTNNSKIKTGWLDYNNSRYNFSVKYPQSFTKTESVNGDGATFTSQSPAITLRIFAVAANGMTADQYLAMEKESLITEQGSIQEISNQAYNLSSLSGRRVVWKYKDPVLGQDTILDQITATKDDVAFNLTMTISFTDYTQYFPMLEQMVATFNP